jgi:hypothetical protein
MTALISAVFFSGCASNSADQAFLSSSGQLWQLFKKPALSDEAIAASPYAILSLKSDNNRPIFLSLGYLEDKRQYWYTQDLVGYAFESGRLVQSYVLPGGVNLTNLSQSEIYPAFGFWSLRPGQTQRFSMTLDLPELQLFGLVAQVVLQAEASESDGLMRVNEQWVLADLNFTAHNWYLLSSVDQQVVASSQQYAPALPRIEYRVVKPWR